MKEYNMKIWSNNGGLYSLPYCIYQIGPITWKELEKHMENRKMWDGYKGFFLTFEEVIRNVEA